MESLILDTDFQKWMDEQDALEVEMILEELRQEWKDQVVSQQQKDLDDELLLDLEMAHMAHSYNNFRRFGR